MSDLRHTDERRRVDRLAVIRWGGESAKRHLYAWEEVRTVCGRDVPTDWMEVAGGVHYEAIRPDWFGYLEDCANCMLAATTENVERCATEWLDRTAREASDV